MKKKRKIILSAVGVGLSLLLLSVSTILAENGRLRPTASTTLVIVSLGFFLAAVFYAAKLEHEVIVYTCRKCGHRFKPTWGAYLLGAHTLTTRRLRCPKCEEKSWCRARWEE